MFLKDFSVNNVTRVLNEKEWGTPTQNNRDIRSFIMRTQTQGNTEGLNSPMIFHGIDGNQDHDLW